MARTIGSPATVTAQKRRETFRLEIEVGGTEAVPVFTLRGHAHYITRDAALAEVGRGEGHITIAVRDDQIPGALRTGIAGILARLDTIALPTDGVAS